MTTKEQIEIIEAYERGEDIEYRLTNEIEWHNLIKTSHDFNFQRFFYRIKQKRCRAYYGEVYYYINYDLKVIEDKEYYTESDDSCCEVGNYFRTKEDAEKARELIEETLTKFHGND